MSPSYGFPFSQPDLIVITNITREQEGLYTCVVGNAVGSSEASAWVTVIGRALLQF